MNAQTVRVSGGDTDGFFVWWEPGRVKKVAFANALTSSGLLPLYPKGDTTMPSLKRALNRLNDALNIKAVGSPVEVVPLKEGVNGFEVVKISRGDTQNAREFLYSAKVENSTEVTFIDVNQTSVPALSMGLTQVTTVVNQMFEEESEFLPTPMVSGCLNNIMRRCLATSCRKAGGIYFVPPVKTDLVRGFADSIKPDASQGFLLIITRAELTPDSATYKLVIKSLREEVETLSYEIEDEMQKLVSLQRTQRSDGKSTRLQKLSSMRAKVAEYESLLGCALDELHEVVNAAERAVNTSTAIDRLM